MLLYVSTLPLENSVWYSLPPLSFVQKLPCLAVGACVDSTQGLLVFRQSVLVSNVLVFMPLKIEVDCS